MTPIEINANEFLAINLNGWHLSNAETGWYDEYDTFICFKSKWNPLEKIAQAFEVVEKMRTLKYTFFLSLREYYKDIFTAIFWSETGVRSKAEHSKVATAITLAACRALGWKEKGDERLRKNRLA